MHYPSHFLRTLFWLFWPLPLCLALAACGAATSTGDARNTPRSVTLVLSPGEQVAITATDTLKLDRVNDSRCRAGAVCVWKGYVSYSFTLLDVDPATPPPIDAPLPTYRVKVKITQGTLKH